MKIQPIGASRVVMSNPHGKANYFAWPSVAKLQNQKIAVVASGYRYAHICPFGKAVISYSENEGETYTAPAPLIDTPLDDRDAGILAYGTSNVIITSFNNSVPFQRASAGHYMAAECDRERVMKLIDRYLDLVTPEEETRFIGSEFRISRDCGVTFGEIYKSPITSPHGPCALHDGTVLWVGTVFDREDVGAEESGILAYRIHSDGTMERIGTIPAIQDDGGVMLCEPYALELPNGTILCHIRAQKYENGTCTCFTTYQSESVDFGKTWSRPHRILGVSDGAPSHLMLHSSGLLISTYGHREQPYGIKAMFSRDHGKTWDAGYDIYTDTVSDDLGYPCSVELKDGSILTVFYAHETQAGPAVIMQQKWRLED